MILRLTAMEVSSLQELMAAKSLPWTGITHLTLQLCSFMLSLKLLQTPQRYFIIFSW